MMRRIALSLTVFLIIATGFALTWQAVRNHDHQQLERLFASESYSTRSYLARHLETLMRALKRVNEFWSEHARLPRDQWESDADIEIDHFAGIESILWFSPQSELRYLHSPEHPVFDYRPSEEQWEQYRSLVDRSQQQKANAILGPFKSEAGKFYFEVHVMGGSGNSGKLAAIIDADELFAGLLEDQSPDYALQVIFRDAVVYRRDEAPADVPESWLVRGDITTSIGGIWTVEHAPTEVVVDQLTSPAQNAVLLLGLVIALLMAWLVFAYARVRHRATRAELSGKELEELNRELEGLVAERTRQLEIRSQDLQTVADSVGHDLRNPLNAVLMNLTLLDTAFRDHLPEKGREILKRIPASLGQMTSILDRLLAITALAHDKFEREQIDMKALLTEAFQTLTDSEPPPPIDLQITDLPPVCADRMLTEILVMNLLGNAIKFTRSKEYREITVDYEVEKGAAFYSIRDNGIGFRNEDAEDLFEAFHRQSDRTASQGSGLGLHMAARIVDRHGGRISASGEPGNGATFCFSLEPDHNSDT